MYSTDPIIESLFFKISRKNQKFHFVTSPKITGHELAIGKPGFGKTSGNRRNVELRWSLNQKIFCLYDAGRMDLAYFMFPSVSDFWKRPKISGRKIIGPRDYPVELLYPVTKKMPKKLPKNAVPFTIPVSDLDEDDMIALSGFQSKETITGMINYMNNYVKKDTTALDYVNIMASALKKVESSDGIKPSHHGARKLKYNVFQPLINEGILSSKKVKTCIDINSMIKDRHTMSVLVLRHCPQKLWGFLVYYFMNHIFKALSGIEGDTRIKISTTIILNEVADLLNSGDDSVGETGDAISKLIGKIAKQYRTAKLYLLMDTQLPQELPDVKNIMSGISVYRSSMMEVQKAMDIMGISERTGMMTADDKYLIPFLNRGWYYYFGQDGVSLHKQVWTRSRTYLDGEDFYDIYDRVYGRMSYLSVENILKELADEKKFAEDTWELKRKLLEKPKIEIKRDLKEPVSKEEVKKVPEPIEIPVPGKQGTRDYAKLKRLMDLP